ncbi:MAG: DNA polymerase III subunit gamma/tau [Pseudomonadota bacterium]|nr:DNA polymerase III subunit gamma/tau [Pseudomonadota bacterium]
MSGSDTAPYQVLARKYRPQAFDELVGQDALVRTLSNAISKGRLHHGYMLTGVRGVGKTTTARIIAKALNCSAADGPTMTPCGKCDDCRLIAEGRHIDVLELDAASRTKVEQMREMLDGVPYLPVQGRYKVYIIDEVHMLSTNAFNALLKTLEEPPSHVVFIFATTEIRKVPVTVLSRCQRFDLRRVPADRLVEHLGRLAEREGATVDAEALRLIARAAEGSVRDSLSLLDQAIAHGGGSADLALVRDMLGLADRQRVLDLFEAVMGGDAPGALGHMRGLYDAGAEPLVVLQDMLEITHWLTATKVAPGNEPAEARSDEERRRGTGLVAALGMPALSRTWSLLLKGVAETRTAPSPLAAAEMTIIRLAYAADLPDPADLVRRLQSGEAPARAPATTAPARPQGGTAGGPPAMSTPPAPRGDAMARPATAPAPQPVTATATATLPKDFRALVAWIEAEREIKLVAELTRNVRLVAYQPGRLEIALEAAAPADFSQRLLRFLRERSGHPWQVSIARSGGAATLAEQDRTAADAARQAMLEDPLVRKVRAVFPEAEIIHAGPPEEPPPAPVAGDEEDMDEE